MGIFNKNKDKSENLIVKQIKNVLKVLLIKAAIMLLISVVIIVMLSSFWYILKKATVTQISGEIRNPSTEDEENEWENKDITIDYSKREYVLDDGFEERVERIIENYKINADSVGLTEDLFKEMYKAEVMTLYPDIRKRDKVGTKIGKNDLQGCVQFTRTYKDGTQEMLEYKPFDDFRTELAKFGYDLQDAEGNSVSQQQIYFSKAEVDKNYKELRRYFTLDEEYNVIVATMNSTESTTTYSDYAKEEGQADEYSYTYSVNTVKINYRSGIEKYSMPLEFTLTMLAVTENPGFCEALLELIRDTKILIEVQDSISTTNMEEKYDYVGNFELEKKIKYYTMKMQIVTEDSEGEESDTDGENQNSQFTPPSELLPQLPQIEGYKPPDTYTLLPELPGINNTTSTVPSLIPKFEWVKVEDESNLTGTYTKGKDMDNPYRKVVINRESMSTKLCVIEANTWMADTKITYDRAETPDNYSNVSNPEDETDFIEVEDYHKLLDTLQENLPSGATVTSREETIKEKKTEQEIQTNTNTTNIRYNEVSTEVFEKEERFLSLLSVDPDTGVFDKEDINKNTKLIKYEDLYGRDTAPETNLLISDEILFDILSSTKETQALEETMRYLLYIYTGNSYGVTEFNFNIYIPQDFTTMGARLSPFGTNLTREEFINLATAASDKYGNDYVEYMVKYAEDFYDVCEEYNVNPALAFAHACLETGCGSTQACKIDKNYFGFAHYNEASSGKKYSTVRESIEDYCEWILDRTNSRTSGYLTALARGEEFSAVNGKFKGTPDTNIYVLYCTYEFLGETHKCDEPDFLNPAGEDYYIENGSNWGKGGRIYIYTMYEKGGLYTGEYAIRCGHKNADDPTTIQERADYSQYKMEQKLTIAKSIFGNGCILGAAGSIVESAYQVADHFLNSGVEVHYAGDDVEEATNNGRSCIYGNIQGSWDKPIQNPGTYGVVCATYVSLSLWNAGLIEEEVVNQYGYNACDGVRAMFDNAYSSQFQQITNYSDLQEGDIVFQPGHVLIYVGEGKGIDQSYCVISSSGSDTRKSLVNVSLGNFEIAYRYVGN